MHFSKRYTRARNSIAVLIFGGSGATLVLPYKEVLSATNSPIRVFHGYEMLFPFPALFCMLVAVFLLVVLKRKWAPVFIMIPSIANLVALYFIRWEVHININGIANTSSGEGFYLLSVLSMSFFVLCCLNMAAIFSYDLPVKQRHDLIDSNL